MGTTIADGIIRQVPYALLKNVNQGLQPVTVYVIGPLRLIAGTAHNQPIHVWQLNSTTGVPIYLNDTVQLIYRGPNQSASDRVCDLYRVNPSTGVESLDSQIFLTTQLQKGVNINITAINAGSGALTTVVSYAI